MPNRACAPLADASDRHGSGRRCQGGIAVLIASVVVLAACGSGSSTPKSSATSTTKKPAHRSSTTTTTTTSPPPDTVLAAPLLPLYPFQTQAEADAWRAGYATSGARPEFTDPGKTALAFAHFLGYTDVDRVITTRVDTKGEHVSVGSTVPDTNRTTIAAVVHLVRYMAGSDAPWEVVGTDDTDFSLTAPVYGAAIRSPLVVGGRISGVDESIKVHVQQLHANGFLGELCCIPAGGQNSPWTGSIVFAQPTDAILMVSASTGGTSATSSGSP